MVKDFLPCAPSQERKSFLDVVLANRYHDYVGRKEGLATQRLRQEPDRAKLSL